MVALMRTITARYPGRCLRGDDRIDVDDVLTYDDDLDTWVHVTCATDPSDAPETAAAPCPHCWQIPSIAGACACDPSTSPEANP